MNIKRGDIVYVEIPYATGHEMMKDRPAVVVSNNAMNFTSPVVSVVYLTGSKPAGGPFHVEVWGAASARHGSSTALCEHIYTVDKDRDMMLRKCQVYGLTHSEASDWAGKWTACGMFNREYNGRPIIEMRRGGGRRPSPPPEPLPGQITLFQEEEKL